MRYVTYISAISWSYIQYSTLVWVSYFENILGNKISIWFTLYTKYESVHCFQCIFCSRWSSASRNVAHFEQQIVDDNTFYIELILRYISCAWGMASTCMYSGTLYISNDIYKHIPYIRTYTLPTYSNILVWNHLKWKNEFKRSHSNLITIKLIYFRYGELSV